MIEKGIRIPPTKQETHPVGKFVRSPWDTLAAARKPKQESKPVVADTTIQDGGIGGAVATPESAPTTALPITTALEAAKETPSAPGGDTLIQKEVVEPPQETPKPDLARPELEKTNGMELKAGEKASFQLNRGEKFAFTLGNSFQYWIEADSRGAVLVNHEVVQPSGHRSKDLMIQPYQVGPQGAIDIYITNLTTEAIPYGKLQRVFTEPALKTPQPLDNRKDERVIPTDSSYRFIENGLYAPLDGKLPENVGVSLAKNRKTNERGDLLNLPNQDCSWVGDRVVVVCDGAGSYAESGKISQALVRALAAKLENCQRAFTTEEGATRYFKNLVSDAMESTINYAKTLGPDFTGMTTLTGGIIVEIGQFKYFLGFNVGDSRTYLMKESAIRTALKKHENDDGKLTRAVGLNKGRVIDHEVDTMVRHVSPGDVVLAISDGAETERLNNWSMAEMEIWIKEKFQKKSKNKMLGQLRKVPLLKKLPWFKPPAQQIVDKLAKHNTFVDDFTALAFVVPEN